MVAKQTRSRHGGFFPLDVSVVNSLAACGLGFEEVLAYAVMAAHTQGRGPSPHRLATSGQKAVHKYAGIPFRAAGKTIKILCEKGVLVPAQQATQLYGADQVPETLGSSRIKPRYYVMGRQDEAEYASNVPHSLLRGVGDGEQPPLARLISQALDSPNDQITLKQARLDVVVLLFNMYRFHSLEAFGGVDPRQGLCRRWVDPDEALVEDMGAVQPIPDTNLALFEVTGGSVVHASGFATQCLGYAPPDKVEARLRLALSNLQRAGLVYETVAVWSADPVTDSNAEPQYTLYIRDEFARRNGEPYLQSDVHRATLGVVLDPPTIWADWSPENSGLIARGARSGGRFRYIGHLEGTETPVGVYRLRYRPQDADNAAGIEREKLQVQGWGAWILTMGDEVREAGAATCALQGFKGSSIQEFKL